MCPVYEGKPVSEENISFWEQVFNEGFINFQSLSQTGFSESTATSNLENMLSCTEGECFSPRCHLDWAGLFCDSSLASTCQFKVLRHARELKDYSGSFKFLTRAAQSASRMTAAYFMSIKTKFWGQLAFISVLWDVPPLSFCCHLSMAEVVSVLV